jgi:hypothetical protein
MKQKTIVIIAFSLLVSLSAICAAFYTGTKRVDTKLVRQMVETEKRGIVGDYEKQLAEKDAVIKAKSEELAQYQRKYRVLVRELAEKGKQRASIKEPSTLEELKERFRALGYAVK